MSEEHRVQKAIVEYLDTVLPFTVRVVAIANKPRSAIQGMLEKQRGARKGIPDLMLTGSFHGFLEVKAPKTGRVSPEQIEWRDWFGAMQVPFAVVRSVDDVRTCLVEWDLPTREMRR